jgi:predicted RNA binding protein YcfA (HicA-like mRNA interferase family)
MPPKLRQSKATLRREGFVEVRVKGSHARWKHKDFADVFLTLSGKDGDDADRYHIEEVARP